MSKPKNDSDDSLSYSSQDSFEKTEHDFTVSAEAAGAKITLSEIQGERPEQQDVIFAALPRGEMACQNPAEFFREKIVKIADDHKHCLMGTTICSAIVTPPSDGERFPKITVANLGDSRALLIAKLRGEKYVSIILTEDHDLENLRIKRHLLISGGVVNRDEFGDNRLDGSGLNLGAAIGDASTKNTRDKTRSPLLTKPDVFEFNLNNFPHDLLPIEEIEDVELVVACDGLFDLNDKKDVIRSDFRLKVMRGEMSFVSCGAASNQKHDLSQIKRKFDQKSPKGHFAANLSAVACDNGSADNISIGSVNLVRRGSNQVGRAIMLTVCDGHIPGDKRMPTSGRIAADADGAIVASSVAADLYLAANAEHVQGLCVDDARILPGQYLQELVRIKAREIASPLPSGASVSATSSVSVASSTRSSQSLNNLS